MRVESLRDLPPTPPSEVEWEDLLLRIEIMPRALEVVAEELERGGEEVERIMRSLTDREEWVGTLLEVGAGLGSERDAEVAVGTEGLEGQRLMDRFVRSRTRNFAIVQRRGIGVWSWVMPITDTVTITPYQLLTQLAHDDVAALAALRALGRRQETTC